MSDLADLNLDEIGVMGYWNALEHGADYIDPEAMLDDPDADATIETYETAANGMEGTLRYPSNNPLHFRVKLDGWIIIWIERDGPLHEMVWDWRATASTPTFPSTRFALGISELNALGDQSGSFAPEDVGYYCPQFPTATHIKLHSEDDALQDEIGYVSTLDVAYWRTMAVARTITDGTTDSAAEVWLSDRKLAAVSGADAEDITVVDPIADGIMPHAQTRYAHDSLRVDAEATKIDHFVIYSVDL